MNRSRKYRKKPIVIEALRFDPNVYRPDFVKMKRQGRGYLPDIYMYFIKTLEGEMKVKEGDWIIEGVKGEHYPCKPDIFEATYEIVEEGD